MITSSKRSQGVLEMELNQKEITEERNVSYEVLNERVSEISIDRRILHIREDGIWVWK